VKVKIEGRVESFRATEAPISKAHEARSEHTGCETGWGQAGRKQKGSRSHGRQIGRTAAASKEFKCSARRIFQAATAKKRNQIRTTPYPNGAYP
jgi:hypothetical protein